MTEEKKSVRLSVQLPAELREQLKDSASKQGKSLREVVEQALQQHLQPQEDSTSSAATTKAATKTTKRKKKTKFWSKSIGEVGNRIRLYEERVGGNIYCEFRDSTAKWGTRTKSLKHKDKDQAIAWAKEQVAKLAAGDETLRSPVPTVEKIVGAYLANATPGKSVSEQQADLRRARMWMAFLGKKFDLSKLTLAKWLEFIRDRRGGTITTCGGMARGNEK